MAKRILLLALAAILAGGSVFVYKMMPFAAGVVADAKARKHAFHKEPLYQTGDIIFQSSMSGQSHAVQLATGSKYSHVGMIFNMDGRLMVFEAVQPVKMTPFDEFVKHGDGKHYVVKRLKNADEMLTPDVVTHMTDLARSYEGKNYDIYFNWSDERMYCSEVVWKIYYEALRLELGERKPLKDYDLSHPIVKATMQERYGDDIPEDELMISPGAMFDSHLLETVAQQ